MNQSGSQQPQVIGEGQPVLGLLDYRMSERGTVIVGKVQRFSSAGKAGIQTGDEIIGINGTRIPNPAEQFVRDVVVKAGVGGVLQMRIRRDGREMDVLVTLRAQKALALSLEDVSEVLERKISP